MVQLLTKLFLAAIVSLHVTLTASDCRLQSKYATSLSEVRSSAREETTSHQGSSTVIASSFEKDKTESLLQEILQLESWVFAQRGAYPAKKDLLAAEWVKIKLIQQALKQKAGHAHDTLFKETDVRLISLLSYSHNQIVAILTPIKKEILSARLPQWPLSSIPE